MKKIITAAIAALTFAAPMAATAAYADPPGRDGNWRGDNNGRDNDRNDRRDNDRNDRRDNDRNDRRDNDRRGERWNGQRHNGYYVNGRFSYGPPPAAYMNRGDFRPGYQAWRRGDRLPSYYRSHYRGVDYRSQRLRAPPRGYHYVQDDRGEILLVGIATGVILSILASQ